MYKSPIETIYGELQTQMVQEDENMVMKAVRKVGVNVDKESLIKALQYDRNQYTKGYEDGKNEVLKEIRDEILRRPYKGFEIGGFKDGYITAMVVVLDVIDKYKTGSEDKESNEVESEDKE